MRRWNPPRTLLLCLLIASSAFAQDAAKPPSFDVATVKAVDPDAKGMMMVGIMQSADGIDAQNVTVLMLMQFAYGRKNFRMDDQIIGLPEWAKSEKYNVQAKMNETEAAKMAKLDREEKQKQLGLMMQAMLTERFGLKLHHGTKTGPDYELVVAKGGPKFKPAPLSDAPKDSDGKPTMRSYISFNTGKLEGHNATMDLLGDIISRSQEVGRQVLDKTGLTGSYDFTMSWLPVLEGMKPRSADGDAPSVFTSLEDDLGLKLVPSTGTQETLIIDQVQHPTPD